MPTIRPVSDLRNHFAEINREVQSTQEPVFLTKNGAGSLVVMSMACYEARRYESEVYDKLMQAQIESETTDLRYDHAQVMEAAQQLLHQAEGKRRA